MATNEIKESEVMKKAIIQTALTCFIGLCWNNTSGQNLDDYVAIGLKNNPLLQMHQLNYQSQLEQVNVQAALPNPKISGGVFISPIETRVGAQVVKLSVSQQLPWFGTQQSKATLSKHRATSFQYKWQDQQLQLIYHIKSAWFQLYKQKRSVAFTKDNIELLKSLERLALKNYEAGQVALAYVLKTQLLIADLENELSTLNSEEVKLLAQFNELLGREADQEVLLPEELFVDSLSLSKIDFQQHPLVLAQESERLSLDETRHLTELLNKPQFTVGVDYGVVQKRGIGEIRDDGKDFLMPSVGLNVPIFKKKNESAARAVKHQHDAAVLAKEASLNRLRAEYADKSGVYQNALERYQVFSDQIEKSREMLDLLISGFSGGSRNFDELLSTQQLILHYQLAGVEAQVIQSITLAQLHYLLTKDN